MAGDRERRPVRFTWQLLGLQLIVVLLLLGAGIGFAFALLGAQASRDAGRRALTVAHTVAAAPGVPQAVAHRRAGGALQRYVTRTCAQTGVLFVVVTDAGGIRLAHPRPDRIGKRVSTDPSAALAGHDVANVRQVGTLGASIRSKVPVRFRGRVVGEVSVGFDTGIASQVVRSKLGWFLAFGAAALGLGIGAAALLTWRLRRQTLGLEPYELTGLVSEREAVLHGIGEGVLALDATGRVMVHNAEARTLLGIELHAGMSLDALALPPRLAAAVAEGDELDNLVTVAGDRVLVVRLRRVRRGQRELGLVVTLRDRTEVETLTRELDSVRGLTDALRAQRHEFTNRLHTLSGLLRLGNEEEATHYLQTLTGERSEGRAAVHEAIEDPHLRALLYAKTVAAQEKGVQLRMGEDSWATGRVTDPLRVTTVLGNLVDNAVRAAAAGSRSPAVVEVDALSDGGTLHLTVLDSGDGVPASLGERVFEEGMSTTAGTGHGIGLTLAARSAQYGGGTLRLAPPAAERGAMFLAVLPGLLERAEVTN